MLVPNWETLGRVEGMFEALCHNFVAPLPEQLGTTTMHFSEVSGDISCIVIYPTRRFSSSGMGATNFQIVYLVYRNVQAIHF